MINSQGTLPDAIYAQALPGAVWRIGDQPDHLADGRYDLLQGLSTEEGWSI
jgi:hypothetical protein